MSYTAIKIGDRRRSGIITDWEKWLKKADKLYSRFNDRLGGDSPFDYHEVAAVGFLANAAAMAKFLPMNEYELFKLGKTDKRTKVAGRADLWFDAGSRCYSIEFKKAREPQTLANLKQRLKYAYKDISCIRNDEYHHAAACLVTVARESKRIEICESFASDEIVDFAYRIGPKNEPAYLYLMLKNC